MTIAVIGKTCAVLASLAGSREPVALARVTEATRLPKPTVYRILQTLAKLGHVAQDEDARYYLTGSLPSLLRSGHWTYLTMRALPWMERLHGMFNETVNLGVLDGLRVRNVHILETTRPLRMHLQPDGTYEFYSTAMGRAIAANIPQEELESLLDAVTLRQITPRTVRSLTELRRVLDETRARGWALDDEETALGVVGLAVPLTKAGRALAAVGVIAPKVRLTSDTRGAIVTQLAAISLSLKE